MLRGSPAIDSRGGGIGLILCAVSYVCCVCVGGSSRGGCFILSLSVLFDVGGCNVAYKDTFTSSRAPFKTHYEPITNNNQLKTA